MPVLDDRRAIGRLLDTVSSVAIVGVSDDPGRPSFGVATYLLEATAWTIWFVNPTIESFGGRQVHAALADLPAVPDLVDVFRRREYLADVTDQAIEVGAGAVWFQQGLRDEDAAERAAAAGLDVVQDRCLRTEHARLG